jgi:hypothetical protein
MFPVIHAIVGITMSIYMNLVIVEAEFLKERGMLSETRDNLTMYVAHLPKEYEHVKEQLW